MAITVQMIEEKEFKTKVRGYDPVEVDEFLDDICDELIVMQGEIANLQARLAQASRNLAYSQPITSPRPVNDASDTAQKLIANAQRLADETIAQAKKEAEEILSGAKAQADDGEVKELAAERDALEKQVNDLRAMARSYRDNLVALMSEQKKALDGVVID